MAVAHLDWRSGEHFDHTGAQPCVCCRVTTSLRSHAGEPVHKVCAENWNDRNPGRDRFHPDPQPKRKIKGDHA